MVLNVDYSYRTDSSYMLDDFLELIFLIKQVKISSKYTWIFN